jgi:hypothetical protein
MVLLYFFLFLRCRIRTWQPLASVNITVSVDPADSIAAFESEKKKRLFQICSGLNSADLVQCVWLIFLRQRQSNVVPVAYSRRI